MIFGQDRDELRKMYFDAWQKSRRDVILTPLESQISAVVAEHPEYHEIIDGRNGSQEYTPDGGQTNPFLHMGLHLAIREQVATNRPAGIRAVYEQICARTGDSHAAEHQMIDCLAEGLWEAQSKNQLPDEQRYLEQLRRLASKT